MFRLRKETAEIKVAKTTELNRAVVTFPDVLVNGPGAVLAF